MAEIKGEGSRIIITALRAAIKDSGRTVQQIADAMGVKRQQIHKLIAEDQNLTLSTIEAIFNACGESFGEWLDDRSHYGRHKSVHEQLQKLLNKKGDTARRTRDTLDAYMTHSAQQEKEKHRDQKREESNQDEV